MSKKYIIGIAGTFASGQDSVGKYLAETHGFLCVSTSDMVREEATSRYGSIERPILFKTATELRAERGGGVLSELALEKFDANSHLPGVAITGLRSLGEARAVQEAGGVIVFTDAPIELRYERMRARNRDAETEISIEEFKEREDREAKTGDSDADFNREAIRELADHHITNDGTLEGFNQKIESILSSI